MSDLFGIGNAIRGCMHIYFRTARATGRTQAMIDILKDGDCVIFTNSKEANRVARMCAEDRGVAIKIQVHNPEGQISQLFNRGPIASKGCRTYFDHSWVEQYYLKSMENAGEWLNNLSRDLNMQAKSLEQAMTETPEWKKDKFAQSVFLTDAKRYRR